MRGRPQYWRIDHYPEKPDENPFTFQPSFSRSPTPPTDSQSYPQGKPMPSPPPPLHPAVSVALYRALLRTCRKGRHPEVFGKRSTSAWLSGVSCTGNYTDADQPKLPNDCQSMKTAIKYLFRTNWAKSVLDIGADFNEEASIPQPFEVLREANLRAMTLLPDPQALPTRLPVFAYEHAALFPGEETTFRFFEPRYKRMVEAVTSPSPESDDGGGGGGGGWFLLRPREPYFVLVRITEHAQLPNGDYAVNVMAGPRVSVIDEASEDPSVGASRLTWIDKYELFTDEDFGDDLPETPYQSLDEMRLRCLDLLMDATSIDNILSISVPPLDPEAFSFFALRFVTSESDVGNKWRWLACRSTSHRLLYVIDLLESFQESKRANEDGIQDSSFGDLEDEKQDLDGEANVQAVETDK